MKRPRPEETEEKERRTYVLLCVAGLERSAVQSLQSFLAAQGFQDAEVELLTDPTAVVRGHAAIGKVLVQTEAPFRVLSQCKVFTCVMAFVCHTEAAEAAGDVEQSLDDGMRFISSAVSEVTDRVWEDALETWTQAREAPAPASAAAPPHGLHADRPFRFRTSCIRDGAHVYKSVHVSKELGTVVGQRFPRWSVDLVGYDIEVVGFMLGGLLTLALTLDPSQHFRAHRPCSEDRAPLVSIERRSTLRPSTAHILLSLLPPDQKSAVVLDPTVGFRHA